MKWSPDVFWNMSMFEYRAAMEGLDTINKMHDEHSNTSGSNKPKLDSSDVDDLKDFLASTEK